MISRRHEDEIADKFDGFVEGINLFGKLAKQDGVVVTKHEALKELVELKYEHPEGYWRCYEPWAAKWRDKYGGA